MPRGTIAGIASAVTFGFVYFLTPLLHPLSAEGVWATRALVTLPFVAIVLLAMRQWYLASDIWRRIKRKPVLLLAGIASSALLAGQLWIFGWAPLNGRAMQVALGYFLLPLVLVVVGRFLYKDRLRWYHWCSTGFAAIGVAVQIVYIGSVSWETFFVAFGYPIYFILRRAVGAAHLGGMFWEFLIMLPAALIVLVSEIVHGTAFAENPALWWSAPAFALAAAVALLLYILASKLLPISIFGLLSYLEPALLVVAALLIGERIAREEYVAYGSIWFAVLILLAGGAFDAARAGVRRRREQPPEPQ